MSEMATTSSPAVRARRTWNMDQWGSGYFDVDDHGQALVRPLGSDAEGPALPISALVRQLQAAGLRLPVLVRFSDILHDRVEQLCGAFDAAMQDVDYQGGYTAVYPIKVNQQLPKVLSESQIDQLGVELASFHRACHNVRNVLPIWSKTMQADLDHLVEICDSEIGQYEHRGNIDTIRRQIDTFCNNSSSLGIDAFDSIPVFIDWNIGNFSLNEKGRFFSRWDYDWFRMSSRVMDFYFFSRVCSGGGDQTVFSYVVDPLNEDRFLRFLSSYHQVFPLSETEILFIKEAYRFFLLNYVIKDGRYFFHEIYATRLQKEAFDTYFPRIDELDTDKMLKKLRL